MIWPRINTTGAGPGVFTNAVTLDRAYSAAEGRYLNQWSRIIHDLLGRR